MAEVLVTAVMDTLFFTCTLAAPNFTLLSVGAAAILMAAVFFSEAVPPALNALKIMDRSPEPAKEKETFQVRLVPLSV